MMLSQEGKQRVERRIRILIADDRPATRSGLKALLTLFAQVEVVGEAANGQESVDLVAEHKPDVVLMDMQMPVMDGLEATRRIKQQWPEVRVIVLTIYTKYRAQALAAGADAFLLKDGSPDKLADAILAEVSGAQGHADTLAQHVARVTQPDH
jgi:DNA-binding NarL/FixJ family response regulator